MYIHDLFSLVDKKQHAQHAAAARTLDCLSYREGKGVRTTWPMDYVMTSRI